MGGELAEARSIATGSAFARFAELAESAKHSFGSAFAEGDFGCGPATAGHGGGVSPHRKSPCKAHRL